MEINYFTILYWFCHTSTWIHHRYTRVPHPEQPPPLLPRTIPLGHPSAPAPSILYLVPNLDWWFISYMILYMFQCHSPKSSHPLPLPQSPKYCLIHLCLFCCLPYRVIVTILNGSFYALIHISLFLPPAATGNHHSTPILCKSKFDYTSTKLTSLHWFSNCHRMKSERMYLGIE